MAQAAARSAYFAAFHAAAALVFERTGVLPKTHGGLNTRFHQVSQTEPAIDPVMRGFLSASYDFKTTADYGYGRTGTITSTMAAAAVQEAERFLTIIRQLLTPPATGSAPAP